MHSSIVALWWGLNTRSLDKRSKASGLASGKSCLNGFPFFFGNFNTNSLASFLVTNSKSCVDGDPRTDIIFWIWSK